MKQTSKKNSQANRLPSFRTDGGRAASKPAAQRSSVKNKKTIANNTVNELVAVRDQVFQKLRASNDAGERRKLNAAYDRLTAEIISANRKAGRRNVGLVGAVQELEAVEYLEKKLGLGDRKRGKGERGKGKKKKKNSKLQTPDSGLTANMHPLEIGSHTAVILASIPGIRSLLGGGKKKKPHRPSAHAAAKRLAERRHGHVRGNTKTIRRSVKNRGRKSEVRGQKRNKTANVEMGFTDSTGFHPVRSSEDYDAGRAGESTATRHHGVKRGSRLDRALATAKRRGRGGQRGMANKARARRPEWSANSEAGFEGKSFDRAEVERWAKHARSLGYKAIVAKIPHTARVQKQIDRLYAEGRRKAEQRRRGTANSRKRKLDVFERHQLKIARDTLKMSNAMAGVMGPPTKEQAREIIKRLTSKSKNSWFGSADGIMGIRPGDRVTIVDRFGKQRTGRATLVYPSHVVLNLGGAHGTPGIGDARNIIKVSKRKNAKRANAAVPKKARALFEKFTGRPSRYDQFGYKAAAGSPVSPAELGRELTGIHLSSNPRADFRRCGQVPNGQCGCDRVFTFPRQTNPAKLCGFERAGQAHFVIAVKNPYKLSAAQSAFAKQAQLNYGYAGAVTYKQQKDHLYPKQGVVHFYHLHGDEGGSLPRLVLIRHANDEYLPKLVGGNYRFEAEGIAN